jgi:RNA polymerase sigma-70 factor, ECF subfamily
MNTLPDSKPTDARQADYLRLFLSSEREVFRYVATLVPTPAEAEEIVQQTAVLLWEKFDAYDPEKPFTPWACRFALNVARQWIARRQRWKALLDGDLASELLRRREELLPEMESRLQLLESCIGKLPDRQRTMLERYYFRRSTVERIATEFRSSIEAIYKTLQRIRRSLRVCIETSQLKEDLS